jgi:hypothetical protein
MRDFQLFLGSDAWTMSDSLPTSSGKIRIGVFFLNGDEDQRSKVREYAPLWAIAGGATRVEFVFDDREMNHIRISFDIANDSRLGRQARNVSDRKLPTMRLKDVNSASTEDRRRRVILHEFGHALGLRHEHLHPQGGIKWKEDVVIKWYKEQGWTEAQVRQHVLKAYTGASYLCKGAGSYDDKSVMIYPILSEWTQNGYSVTPSSQLSPNDLSCVNSIYG